MGVNCSWDKQCTRRCSRRSFRTSFKKLLPQFMIVTWSFTWSVIRCLNLILLACTQSTIISSRKFQSTQDASTTNRYITAKIFFNGPKHTHQLRVHSGKRKIKIWQNGKKKNQSHLEFHSIFNQDGLYKFSKRNLQFRRAKKGKTNSSPWWDFKNLFKFDWKRPEHLKAGLFFIV